jgi:glycerophosphoryl diester phosphodiesterase
MKKTLLFLVTALIGISCSNELEVLVPQFDDGGFIDQTRPLSPEAKARMDGIYSVTEGADRFGETVVLRWTGETVSIYTGVGVGQFILRGGELDTVIILQGYWRKLVNEETGLASFYITREEGGSFISGDTTGASAESIRLQGNYGEGDAAPSINLTLQFLRPINPSLLTQGFQILAHRGGGRTSDHLPASENTVEIIRLAQQLGSTGVEIDVRLTKDGVPILYHDAALNPRLTQKTPLVGGVEDYTFIQLRAAIKLINGERIPTLQEALDVILEETTLSFVWLDTKTEGRNIVEVMAPIQADILARAQAMGRDLEVRVGIPTQEVYDEVLRYPGYTDLPTLCELDIEKVRTVDAGVWAPRWTEGTQNENVAAMHAEGREAFVWTLDVPEYINQFMIQGDFDGILTNYPSAVAFYYYSQE